VIILSHKKATEGKKKPMHIYRADLLRRAGRMCPTPVFDTNRGGRAIK